MKTFFFVGTGDKEVETRLKSTGLVYVNYDELNHGWRFCEGKKLTINLKFGIGGRNRKKVGSSSFSVFFVVVFF